MESIGAELQFLTPRPFVGEQFDALRSISEERRSCRYGTFSVRRS